MDLYQIIFRGELIPGAQPEAVRFNFAKLFQADEARLDVLFSGRMLVLKQHLDLATAQKYQQALERAGARVSLLEMEGEEVSFPHMAAEPAPPVVSPLPVGDPYRVAFGSVQAPDFGIAALGAPLSSQTPVPGVAVPDVDHLSLAPAGCDLEPLRAPAPPAAPDTSHLRLSD